VLAALPAQLHGDVLTVDVGAADPSRPVPAAQATNQVTVGLTGDREIHWGGPDRAAEKAAVLLPLLGQSGHRYDVSSPELPTIRP
jgi:cell division protein FtsQ